MSDSPSDSPIFVVGVRRSGTTLVRYVLNSSDRIHERVAGSQLASFGYRPDRSTAMSGRERIRYAELASKYAVNRAGRRALEFAGVFGPN